MRVFFRHPIVRIAFVIGLIFLASFALKNVSLAQGETEGTLPRVGVGFSSQRVLFGTPGTTITVSDHATGRTIVASSGPWIHDPSFAALNNGNFCISWQTGPSGSMTITVKAEQGPSETDDAFAARCKNKVRAMANQFPPTTATTQMPSGGSLTRFSARQSPATSAGHNRLEEIDGDVWAAVWMTDPSWVIGSDHLQAILDARQEVDEGDDDYALRCAGKLKTFQQTPYFPMN